MLAVDFQTIWKRVYVPPHSLTPRFCHRSISIIQLIPHPSITASIKYFFHLVTSASWCRICLLNCYSTCFLM